MLKNLIARSVPKRTKLANKVFYALCSLVMLMFTVATISSCNKKEEVTIPKHTPQVCESNLGGFALKLKEFSAAQKLLIEKSK